MCLTKRDLIFNANQTLCIRKSWGDSNQYLLLFISRRREKVEVSVDVLNVKNTHLVGQNVCTQKKR